MIIYGLIAIGSFGAAFSSLRADGVTRIPSACLALVAALLWPIYWLTVAYWWWR